MSFKRQMSSVRITNGVFSPLTHKRDEKLFAAPFVIALFALMNFTFYISIDY